MANRFDIAGDSEEIKTSDAISKAAEKFRQKNKSWYTRAGEAVSDFASDVGDTISSGVDYIGGLGEGVGTRFGPIPGSEKEDKEKAKQESALEESMQERIDSVIDTAKEAAAEAGTSLEEDSELQSAVKSELEAAVGKERAAKVELAPAAKKEAIGVEPSVETYTPEQPSVEEGKLDEGVEEDGDNQVDQTLSLFKDLPNPLDLAKERDLVTEEFLNEIAAAKEAYNQTKDEVARKKLWDGIVTGMANIVAGLYGIQTGIDLSGVKFDLMDWSGEMSQAASDLAAARALAKDVKDIKMGALDEKRDQRLREIQSTRQINSDALDKLEFERRNRKEENAKIQMRLESIAQQNLAVEDKIADSELYKTYKEDKKRLESLYNKLPTMKSSDADDTISVMKDISNSMQAKVDRINQRLPGGEQFNNQYPPELFAPTRGMFGGQKNPKLSDLVERGMQISQTGDQGDVKAQALSRAKSAGMSAQDLRVYENYLNNPGEYRADAIREMLSGYGL